MGVRVRVRGGLAPEVVGVLPARVAAVHRAKALRRDLLDAYRHGASRVEERHLLRRASLADVDGAVAAGHLVRDRARVRARARVRVRVRVSVAVRVRVRVGVV